MLIPRIAEPETEFQSTFVQIYNNSDLSYFKGGDAIVTSN